MNDYKELIEALDCGEYIVFKAGNAKVRQVTKYNNKIAEAIEQLIKERDAAAADLNKARSCITCKSDSLDFCEGCDSWRSKCNWEWRGV